jgi:Lon protease-like protein
MASDSPIAVNGQDAGASDIAIFPLNLVLFPGGALALKIFEQRYQEMTKACLRDELPFGVCRIRKGNEVGAPADHETMGCSARINDWEMPHPGLFHLNCLGEYVFRLVSSRVEENGLIHGDVEWLTDTGGAADARAFDVCRSALKRFVERVGERFVADPSAFDDPAWVSYRLAEVLPVDAQIKQDLLEQRSAALRVSRIAELLQSV